MTTETETFKIRIGCTTQKDLNINNKKINRNTFNTVKLPDYISKVFILFEDNFHSKTDDNYINKTLEFYTNKNLTEEEFSFFIDNLKKSNIISNRKYPKIQMLDNDGDMVYNYNFNLNKPFSYKKIIATYHHSCLYIKY
jgi:hypothetical protein